MPEMSEGRTSSLQTVAASFIRYSRLSPEPTRYLVPSTSIILTQLRRSVAGSIV